MTTIVRDDPVEAGGDSPQRRRRVAAIFTVGLVFVGAVAGWRWWHDSPEVFGEPGGIVISGPADVGERLNVGQIFPTRAVEVVRIEPVFAAGSAAAAVSVHLCIPADRGGRVGASTGNLSTYCNDLLPIDHTRVGSGDDDSYLVASVFPLEPGTVVVDGFRITYQDGWRTFTDHGGPGITTTAAS